MLPRKINLPLFFAAIALAAGCGPPPPAKPLLYHIQVAGAAATVEVASSPESRAKGLSGREKLEPDEGMLFLFPGTARVSFWMKDTHVPLSIAFITDDGKITRIADMKPETLEPHDSGGPVQMALEMPSGWFERNGVRPGDAVVLPAEVRRLSAL